MKKIIITYFLLVCTCLLIAQNKRPVTIDKQIINKWIHATVNIECRPELSKEHTQLENLYKQHKIDKKTYDDNNNRLNEISYSGTALFLKYNNSYYFLTARHVIYDMSSSDTNAICWKILLIENDTLINNTKGVQDDSFENVYIGKGAELTTLFKSMLSKYYYIFSSVKDDIGIIKIDALLDNFSVTLLKRGYIPITINDIDTSFKVKNWINIFTIGFPAESLAYTKRLTEQTQRIESSLITIPFVSVGKVSNTLKGSSFFESDIFCYHGYSGGAIVDVKRSKLIGIVSGYYPDTIELYDKPPFEKYYLYHSRFIKSSLILPLLKELESKYKKHPSPY